MSTSDSFRPCTAVNAIFHDGASAVSHTAMLRLLDEGLEISTHQGAWSAFWPYHDIIVNSPPHDGISASLSARHMPAASLEVSETTFTYIKPHIRHSAVNWRVMGMIVSCLAMLGVTIFWLIPAAAPILADMVPESIEENLASLMLDQLGKDGRLCSSGAALVQVEHVVAKLTHGEAMPAPNIYLLDVNYANAFTLPSHIIVISSKMIEEAESPDELAGALAHELGHMKYNHNMQYIIQNLGIAGMIDVFGGGGSAMITLITQLYQSSYSRDMERQADQFAAEIMMRHHYNPHAISQFFRRLQKNKKYPEGIYNKIPGWISTHPSNEERMQFFNSLPGISSPTSIMSASDWRELKSLKGCQAISDNKKTEDKDK